MQAIADSNPQEVSELMFIQNDDEKTINNIIYLTVSIGQSCEQSTKKYDNYIMNEAYDFVYHYNYVEYTLFYVTKQQ